MGVVVAVTTRRGRIHTVARELLREVEGESVLFGASPSAAPVPEIGEALTAPSAAASGLSQRSRIAKISSADLALDGALRHTMRGEFRVKLWETCYPYVQGDHAQ
jgi:hypothetical protein